MKELILDCVKKYNSVCDFDENDLKFLTNTMLETDDREHDFMKYNRDIMFSEDVYELTDEPSELPMHGNNLYMMDDKMKSIIDKFDPQYSVFLGEDSPFLSGKITSGNYLYRMEESHPELKNNPYNGCPTRLRLVNDNFILVEQGKICTDLTLALIKNDYGLVVLLGSDFGDRFDKNNHIYIQKKILTEYYHMTISE